MSGEVTVVVKVEPGRAVVKEPWNRKAPTGALPAKELLKEESDGVPVEVIVDEVPIK